MRKLIENLFSGDEKLDFYLGIIDLVEGITSRLPEGAWRRMGTDTELYNSVVDALSEAGYMALGVPEEYGGMGEGLLGPIIVTDCLAQQGINSFGQLGTHFSRKPVIKFGTPEQIEKYVVPTVSGEKSYAICATEPDAGTNTFNISTRAVKKGNKWVVNGQKTFITRANLTDFGFLICKTGNAEAVQDPLSVFVLDMKAPGIGLQKLNITDVGQDEQFTVFIDNVELDEDALIGEEGNGAHYMFEGLNAERLMVSAIGVGFSDKALSAAKEHVNSRVLFGNTPIGAYQAVQHPLAKHKAETDAARLMLYYGVKLFDQGVNAGLEANMAKYLASTAAEKMADATIQSHGGSGLDGDVGLMGLWKMARILRIAPINNEMILNYIAERGIGLPRSY